MKKIIVVDDNEAAADGLTRLLNAIGFDARAQYSGEGLLACIQEEAPDIAIIDIGMPQMDGYETVAMLRNQGYTFPTIALTGYGQQEDKDKALAAGFTSHLVKPAGLTELQEALEAFISKA